MNAYWHLRAADPNPRTSRLPQDGLILHTECRGARHGKEPPFELTGVEIECGDVPAHPRIICAGVADDDGVWGYNRRARQRVRDSLFAPDQGAWAPLEFSPQNASGVQAVDSVGSNWGPVLPRGKARAVQPRAAVFAFTDFGSTLRSDSRFAPTSARI